MRKKVTKKRKRGLGRVARTAAGRMRGKGRVDTVSIEGPQGDVTPMLRSGASAATLRADEPASRLVSYDETLLERARARWEFGDWDSLAELDRVTLQNHPQRDKLALLAAAGYLQKGNKDEACQLIRLAQDWGCGKRLIGQIMIAGVHNTLGRAAAIAGQQSRALKHFESAIATGTPGSEVRLIAQARASRQVTQLGLSDDHGNRQAFDDEAGSRPAITGARDLVSLETLQKQNTELVAQLRKHGEAVSSLRLDMEKLLKQKILNSTKQLEAYIEVRNYLSTGEMIGDMHGWPISPDFALYLVELIETNDYDVVIEFGSGTSTLLIARTLGKNRARRQGKAPVVQVAFEHLPQYHAQTSAQLQRAGLADAVQLVHAPLVPYVAPNGISYSYYDCHKTLARLAQSLNLSGRRILVLVDGPPGPTGKHARYPAVPILLANIRVHHVDILLDDYNRPDEKAVAKRWLGDIRDQGLQCGVTEKRLEKGACFITASAPTAV